MAVERKEQIIDAGVEIAAKGGIAAVTLSAVARRIRCSHGTVSFQMGNLSGLRKAVKAAAIKRKDARVMKWLQVAGEI